MPTTYQLKVYKSWNGRSDEGQFSNSYEFQSDLAIDSPAMAAQVTAFVDQVERRLLLQRTHFMRAVVATYGKEGRNPAPGTFITIPLVGTGQRPVSDVDPAAALDVCLSVKWTAAGGRSGRTLYRGALKESEINESGGKWVLTPVQAIGDMTNVFVEFLAAAGHLPIGIGVTPATNQSAVRLFTAGGVAGVTILKRNRRRKKKQAAVDTGNPWIDAGVEMAGSLLENALQYLLKVPQSTTAQRALYAGALRGLTAALPPIVAYIEPPPPEAQA